MYSTVYLPMGLYFVIHRLIFLFSIFRSFFFFFFFFLRFYAFSIFLLAALPPPLLTFG